MSKKVNVIVTVRIAMLLEDDVEVSEVIQEMDYEFTPNPSQKAIFTDTEIRDYNIKDTQ